ncbi:diacylglycerol kinase family protein [Brevibacillus daliensis]|uniref:diacylglycerol kinase family protein n=1 Tax=Brevibacillus daliensis TaxID=2892995 RepID=UPI001E35F17C|nr:diacylglycerol kinase family protein [Brevibacillus daliensis]
MKEVKRLWRSFGYAAEGWRHAIKTQRNLQIHVGVALAVVVLAYLLQVTRLEFSLLLLTIALVWGLELMNTAIEAVVDLVSPDFHPLAKIAKDVAAGAVFIAVIIAVTIGIIIFGPPLYDIFAPMVVGTGK